MYKVIFEFLDLEDDMHLYKVGDVYPRNGKTATLERATELMGKKNKAGIPLIIEEDAVEKPKKSTAKKGK